MKSAFIAGTVGRLQLAEPSKQHSFIRSPPSMTGNVVRPGVEEPKRSCRRNLMLLTLGIRLGPYEILSALGARGMGEARARYRAAGPTGTKLVARTQPEKQGTHHDL